MVGLRVDTMPDKLAYFEGESFDPTGMVVSAVYNDGTSIPVTDYVYSDIVDGVVTITYLSYSINIDITIKTVKDLLVDFEYTENADGTYTITDWKKTLNGEPSTECIIPEHELIH